MTDLALMLFVLGVSLGAVWLTATSPITPEERDEMLRDEEMWP